ncbi:phosphoribosylformylglycinamidine synthase-like isoform X2 [Liolophura sinensis]|uniref:phosphoribosylformylglycinamidine synthase-like isoform X2 n=1 Tax=Liolophura sinensis TaxID=3198878 RepID=UPI003158E172
MTIQKIYKQPALSEGTTKLLKSRIKGLLKKDVSVLQTEHCYYILTSTQAITDEEEKKLLWILGTPFLEGNVQRTSQLKPSVQDTDLLLEIGPRLNFSTAFSTNACSICRSVGLKNVQRIESSTRYLIRFTDGYKPSLKEEELILSIMHDKMTQCRYQQPLDSFELNVSPEEVYEIDVLGSGKAALEKANRELGLAFDSWDLEYYTELFCEKMKRNPTNVECFDLAQSNSEHSRHWFFKGRMQIEELEEEEDLFSQIMATQITSNNNNIIKFSDNSSCIKGYEVKCLSSENPCKAAPFCVKDEARHIVFTAETHNFPTGVAPFPGATTGTGGRIRDVQATGRGAHVVAGTAGYSFGNLHIPGYPLPWEDPSFEYPSNFASPVEVAIEASNGASDYGNKFGEPVLTGFARSFGMKLSNGERREYIKPIMFSGGIGMLSSEHVCKEEAQKGMEVVKLGGPVYRIGVGGGAASSIQVQGDNQAELDYGAVQRGDAEMEQKLNRVIRGCVEMRQNPICSIHDQGAGGNGNVLKEIVAPAGAVIRAEDFEMGDPTINILELWGAEYQESNAALVRQADRGVLDALSQRERCPVCYVGTVTGDGKIRLIDREKITEENGREAKRARTDCPVDLDLELVLGKMPRKVFKLERSLPPVEGLTLPENLSVLDALQRVLRLPSVASKRYLTNKVDRSVTGLVAQQQCVGPLHTPLADVAITALSYFGKTGSATAIGEQPIKGLIEPAQGARMAVGEALTNLVFAQITNLKDVKCSGNWMWPAKLPGEGAALVDACKAMCAVMKDLGIAVDGGKDSLSMAARVGQDTIKAPGTLVISVYAGCEDITATITPDLKCTYDKGALLYVPFSRGRNRLGGSALAQCYQQLGDDSPDLDDPQLFVQAFNVTQNLIQEGLLTGGHDVSDGGLITCLLEMAFAGNCGIHVDIPAFEDGSEIEVLFAEELGVVLEIPNYNRDVVPKFYQSKDVPCFLIGSSRKSDEPLVSVSVGTKEVLTHRMTQLRDLWEQTSFQLERLQCNPECVEQEQAGLRERGEPPYHTPFLITDPMIPLGTSTAGKPKVAIIREEGSNGDREMAAAFHMAGFETWDVNMEDLCTEQITLEQFRGVAFVGGFSYADVCGSAKGWAAAILFNSVVRDQFMQFRDRPDTFSLGVCNGCQLMALLGWVAPMGKESGDSLNQQGVLFDHNVSERYESRFATVKVVSSPSVLLKDMEDTVFGMWVSHGEGRVVFKSDSVYKNVIGKNLSPVRYVDDKGIATTTYPLNPNGSVDGIASLCSEDGRHLAIMPHPERAFLAWQCPWMPYKQRQEGGLLSPWIKMFQNAYSWCIEPPPSCA